MFDSINKIYLTCEETSEVVVLPKECKEIASFAFKNSDIKKVICNEGLTKISSNAFLGSKIKEIELPTTLLCIGDDAFRNCFDLESICFNDGLKEIGSYSFSYTKIEKVHIPSSVSKIGTNPLMGCSLLENISVDEENKTYSSFMNSNSICELSTHKLIAGCKKTIISDSIIEICDDALNGVGLEHITIPDNCRTLGKQCFANNNLVTLSLNNVSDVSVGAFMNNIYLKELRLSNKLTSVNSSIVSMCDKLGTIVLPNSNKFICTDGFRNYLGTTIFVDKNIEVIEERAFCFCPRLINIKFLGTKAQWLKAIANRNVFYLNDTDPCKYVVVCYDGKLHIDIIK